MTLSLRPALYQLKKYFPESSLSRFIQEQQNDTKLVNLQKNKPHLFCIIENIICFKKVTLGVKRYLPCWPLRLNVELLRRAHIVDNFFTSGDLSSRESCPKSFISVTTRKHIKKYIVNTVFSIPANLGKGSPWEFHF